MGGQDFAGVEGDGGDGDLVDQGQDAGAAVGGGDVEVVKFACSAQGDASGFVDPVVADAVVAVAYVMNPDTLSSTTQKPPTNSWLEVSA